MPFFLHFLKTSPVTGMMLAVAAVAAGAAFADVQSSNIVGYRGEDCTEARYVSVKFWQVGNADGECNLMDVLDKTTVADWIDTIDVYNAEEGCDWNYTWTGDAWIDADNNELALEVVPGVSFLATAENEWQFAGEVPEMTTYDHVIDGPTYIGNAFPIDATYADFDWAGSLGGWIDTIDVYNAEESCDYNYTWTGEEFIDADNNPLDMSSLAEGALINPESGVESITQIFPGYVVK